MKRVPNCQRSAFATVWGKLLEDAVFTKQVSSWAAFFMFPKCILWSPTRGGKRLAKKQNMAALVKLRLCKWNTDRKGLWSDVLERSKKPLISHEPSKAKPDGSRLEAAVIAALRLGDARKALQMLNSAPIAAKTPETLACLRKLHPHGDNPAPAPHSDAPRFNEFIWPWICRRLV